MNSPDVYTFHTLRHILTELRWDKKRKIPLRPSAGMQQFSDIYSNPLLHVCLQFSQFYVPHPVGEKPQYGWVYGKGVFEKLLDTFESRGFDLTHSPVLFFAMNGHESVARRLIDRGAKATPPEGALVRVPALALFHQVEDGKSTFQSPLASFLALLDEAGQDWAMGVMSDSAGKPPESLIDHMKSFAPVLSDAQWEIIHHAEEKLVEKERLRLESTLPPSSTPPAPARSQRL